jgi:pentatricopeptide repeat protein
MHVINPLAKELTIAVPIRENKLYSEADKKTSTKSPILIAIQQVATSITDRKNKIRLIYKNQLLSQAAKVKDFVKAQKIFQEIKTAGLQPDVYSYSSMFHIFSHLKNMEEVEKIYKEMQEANIKPDVVIFNTILGLYEQLQDSEKLKHFHESMLNQKVKPNLVTYRILWRHCQAVKDEVWALALFEEAKGYKIPIGGKEFSLILDVVENKQGLQGALKLFNESKDVVSLDVYCYNHIIYLLKQNNQLDEALKIYEELDKNKIKPDQALYNTVIDILFLKNELKKAESLFDKAGLSLSKIKAKNHDILDCHGLSGGAACVMISKYIQAAERTSFVIVTGIGNHSKNQEKYKMKNTVMSFLKRFVVFKAYSDQENEGRIKVRRNSKTSMA